MCMYVCACVCVHTVVTEKQRETQQPYELIPGFDVDWTWIQPLASLIVSNNPGIPYIIDFSSTLVNVSHRVIT